jgi:GTP-binding protein
MNIRNVAIIAHVDHGKTTLVDQLLRQSGAFRANQQVMERAMDSNDLERERGITILAKCTSVQWGDIRINIVDTPGHADFGGEVERILSMVDGVVVLVDAAEGPMPQTKFVVSKALAKGLKPIVVVNKVDRQDARVTEVHNEVFDLFAALGANDDQLDFPTLFASGRAGWAVADLNNPRENLHELFNLIVEYVPAPIANSAEPFAMLITTLESDPYLGRVLTGRIHSGVARMNMPVKSLSLTGNSIIETARLTKLLAFRGLERVPVEEAFAGDIIAIAGLSETTVADTICSTEITTALPGQPIDPPTLAMTFSVNDSPLAGREGTKVTSRMIVERLRREAEGNVSIRVQTSSENDAVEVAGRGELQLGVLIETMRREGFELSISQPRVLFKTDASGAKLEPIEEVQIDVDDNYCGVVVEKMAGRKGELLDMRPSGGGKTRITFSAPTRGLIGYQGEFMTDTRGTGIMNRLFKGYEAWRGGIEGRRNGVLISTEDGNAVAYALWKLEDRGPMMIQPGMPVYRGMVIGAHTRDNDLEVNPVKAKQLTNIRTTAKDEAVRLTPPIQFTLEQTIAYMESDELVEVTPKSVRLRKRYLDSNQRKRYEKAKED